MPDNKMIGYTIPNRRRDRRMMMPPIQVEIAGEEFTTVDWSFGGFLAGDYKGNLRKGDGIKVTLIANIGDELIRHQIDAEVIRDGRKDGFLAASFDQLDAGTVDTLDRVVTARMHGRRPS